MCPAHNEKWKKTNNGKNRTDKFGKNQNAWRKEKSQVLGNIGNGHQTSEDERKNNKRVSQTNKLASRKQTLAVEISSKG